MKTDRDLYIAWLEVQLGNGELEEEWRESRRGKQNAKENRRETAEASTTRGYSGREGAES
jgi:hypothetical protein